MAKKDRHPGDELDQAGEKIAFGFAQFALALLASKGGVVVEPLDGESLSRGFRIRLEAQ